MKTVRLSVKIHQFISVVLILVVFGCVNTSKKEKADNAAESEEKVSNTFFKLSLAQWSLNRTFDDKGAVSYTHLTLPTMLAQCSCRWWR